MRHVSQQQGIIKYIHINHVVNNVNNWSKLNVIELNSLTYQRLISYIREENLKVVHTVELFDVHLSSDLNWSTHINNVCSKLASVYLHFE